MNILAIETSSNLCSVALQIDDQITHLEELAPQLQAQKILPMIQTLLQQSNISLNQLDALAFGCGPGSFTGVRIATSVVQGIGYAQDLPLIPISSLAALAQSTYMELKWEKLLVAIDARIQEIYWGAYQVNSHGLVELINKEVVCPPKDLISSPFGNHNEGDGVGNAWDVYSSEIPLKPFRTDPNRLPNATGILPLAKLRYEHKQWVNPADALPTYLRDDVARKS